MGNLFVGLLFLNGFLIQLLDCSTIAFQLENSMKLFFSILFVTYVATIMT